MKLQILLTPALLSIAALAADSNWPTYQIYDSTLDIAAYTIKAPPGWRFSGLMVHPPCNNDLTVPIIRVTSPDESLGLYVEAPLSWNYITGRGVNPNSPTGPGCMPWKDPSARDVLTYAIGALQLKFVNWLPVDLSKEQAQAQRLNALSRLQRIDFEKAAAAVEYSVNNAPFEEKIVAHMNCTQSTNPNLPIQMHGCNATISRVWAPKGQLANQYAMLDSILASAQANPAWQQKWKAALDSHWAQLRQEQMAMLRAQGERFAAQMQHSHEAYMASMQRGRDIRNQQFADHIYNKQKHSDDFVDHVLGCTRLSNNVSVGTLCTNRQTAPYSN